MPKAQPSCAQGGPVPRRVLVIFLPPRAPVAQGIEQRPPEPCAHVRIVSGAPAEPLAIRPLSWPFPLCLRGASLPGPVIPGFPGPPAGVPRGRHHSSDLQLSQCSKSAPHSPPRTRQNISTVCPRQPLHPQGTGRVPLAAGVPPDSRCTSRRASPQDVADGQRVDLAECLEHPGLDGRVELFGRRDSH
jgi:hypothetical protein